MWSCNCVSACVCPIWAIPGESSSERQLSHATPAAQQPRYRVAITAPHGKAACIEGAELFTVSLLEAGRAPATAMFNPLLHTESMRRVDQ